ncbi:hypothetical protein [Pseudoalteromonas sp.]|uniref:hypothetical protein n=1 Tax=Pseudoalteromonas sp. TaxID=53249 RepID=UPI00356A066E
MCQPLLHRQVVSLVRGMTVASHNSVFAIRPSGFMLRLDIYLYSDTCLLTSLEFATVY